MTVQPAPAPKWFAPVALAAIAWNALGVFAFGMDATMSEAARSALPDAQRALYEATPAWATGAYGLAVIAGLAGAVLLWRRSRLAAPLFAVSLAAALAQMTYVFALTPALAVMGPQSALLPALVVIIGGALLLLARRAGARGWTR